MADLHSEYGFDLFSEIDDLCAAESKLDTEISFKNVDEINTDLGLPSFDTLNNSDVIPLDYNDCFIDINDNPLFNQTDNVINKDELIISSSFASESIMKVSFPALQDDDDFSLSAGPSRSKDIDCNSAPADFTDKSCFNNSDSVTVPLPQTIKESEEDTSKMVAPLIFPEVCRSYVAIPKCDTIQADRIAPILPTIEKPANVMTVSVAAAAATVVSSSTDASAINVDQINNQLVSESTPMQVDVKNEVKYSEHVDNRPSPNPLNTPTSSRNKLYINPTQDKTVSVKCYPTRQNSKKIQEKLNSISSKLIENSQSTRSLRKRKHNKVEKTDTLPFYSKKTCNKPTIRTAKASIDSDLKFKAYELEELVDPALEKCRKNAINAKKNRELKKQRMGELEKSITQVSEERDELAGKNETLVKEKDELINEIAYLKNIIKNQSELSNILQKIGPTEIKFNSPNIDDITSSARSRCR